MQQPPQFTMGFLQEFCRPIEPNPKERVSGHKTANRRTCMYTHTHTLSLTPSHPFTLSNIHIRMGYTLCCHVFRCVHHSTRCAVALMISRRSDPRPVTAVLLVHSSSSSSKRAAALDLTFFVPVSAHTHSPPPPFFLLTHLQIHVTHTHTHTHTHTAVLCSAVQQRRAQSVGQGALTLPFLQALWQALSRQDQLSYEDDARTVRVHVHGCVCACVCVCVCLSGDTVT